MGQNFLNSNSYSDSTKVFQDPRSWMPIQLSCYNTLVLDFCRCDSLPSLCRACRNFAKQFNLFWCIIEPSTYRRKAKLDIEKNPKPHQSNGHIKPMAKIWLSVTLFSNHERCPTKFFEVGEPPIVAINTTLH